MSKSYAGRCAGCGAVVALMVSPDPEPDFLDGNPKEHKVRYRKEVAREVADWINIGLVVSIMDSEEAKQAWGGCTCDKQAPLPIAEA